MRVSYKTKRQSDRVVCGRKPPKTATWAAPRLSGAWEGGPGLANGGRNVFGWFTKPLGVPVAAALWPSNNQSPRILSACGLCSHDMATCACRWLQAIDTQQLAAQPARRKVGFLNACRLWVINHLTIPSQTTKYTFVSHILVPAVEALCHGPTCCRHFSCTLHKLAVFYR